MEKAPANWDRITELDQILIPTSNGYKARNILTLMSFGRNILESSNGFGLAPLHFIEQRGPYQDGQTPLDMRWDTRTIQIVIGERFLNRSNFFDRRWMIIDRLRPNRSFGTFISPSGFQYPTAPLIYRKWLPGGKVERGTDLVTTAGDGTVTSRLGKFVHNGLRVGMGFVITSGADAGNYIVTAVENDYTITINPAPAAGATNIHWRYSRAHSFRDLYCLLERGPDFDEGGRTSVHPAGYREALRFVAHDPFWYGEEQSDSWVTPTAIGDLIFDYGTGPAIDEAGAWLGVNPGEGRWLFEEDFVGGQIGIIYWGHEVAYPTIEITGPATDFYIVNGVTGASLTFDYSIAAGQTVVIDTVDLSVTDNFGNDLYQYLSGDVSAFSIGTEPQVPDRNNLITATYADGDENSYARIKWRNKYVSL